MRSDETRGARDPVSIVPMCREHAAQVLAIYGEGIADGDATFETEVPSWHGFRVAKREELSLVAVEPSGRVQGWAACSPVSQRPAYVGVVELSVYVAGRARGHGVGAQLLDALVAAADRAGVWTIQASLFPENAASLALHTRAGFRVVGTRERIARQHGRWRDTVLVERRSPVEPPGMS